MTTTYVIGEIGQNHNGSVDLAKKLIDLASKNIIDKFSGDTLKGTNAVKFTKRDLNFEVTKSHFHKPYNSPHSFGATYLEHRKALELSNEQHFELYKYSKEKGLDFIETLCAPSCLNLCQLFVPDKLKVASRDLTNLPLIEELAKTKIPLILSTGMSGKNELDEALDIITKQHSNISILHCTSEYPAQYKNINLLSIRYLKSNYSNYKIGFSDHSTGIAMPVAAVAMGAEIIEKHITLDRGMKGTDHACSLGPDGLKRMLRDLRNLETAMGEDNVFLSEAAEIARQKLERSIATKREIKKGEIISASAIHLLSPGDGLRWNQRQEIIGKKALFDIPTNEIIYSNLIG